MDYTSVKLSKVKRNATLRVVVEKTLSNFLDFGLIRQTFLHELLRMATRGKLRTTRQINQLLTKRK